MGEQVALSQFGAPVKGALRPTDSPLVAFPRSLKSLVVVFLFSSRLAFSYVGFRCCSHSSDTMAPALVGYSTAEPRSTTSWESHEDPFARQYQNIREALAFCNALPKQSDNAEMGCQDARAGGTGSLAPQASGGQRRSTPLQDFQPLRPRDDHLLRPEEPLARLFSELSGLPVPSRCCATTGRSFWGRLALAGPY